MTVGFHSPLPPTHSGVADYSATLLAHLRKRGPIALDATDTRINLYHLGNNQLHRPIYNRALAHAGIVVLHDAVLQHFYLGALPESQYIDEYVYNYGEWERDAARTLYRERAASATQIRYFRRPMLRRIAESARAIIVHNAAAARMLREHASAARIIEIPHFFEPGAPTQSRSDSPDILFGVFGYLRESKRLLIVLQAFQKLLQTHPRAQLLVAGEFASPDLARAVEPWRTHPNIRWQPHLAPSAFALAAASVDVCINLRYPSAGETSGIGIRLMGIGKPVIFTDGDELAGIPQAACLRVSPGVEEAAELFHYMKLLADTPTLAREIGSRAAAHIREFHAIDHVADLYWKTLCDFS